MTLRSRLLLMIGVSLILLWGVVAVWLLRDLDSEMRRTLDRRLAMSAQMVAALMSKNPAAWTGQTAKAGVSALIMPPAGKGLACQVSSVRGEVFARTPGAAPRVSASMAPGFADIDIKGEHWRSYTFETRDLRVTTADRLSERDKLLHDVAIAAVVPFVVALFGGLIVLALGVKRGLLPLERLRQGLANRAPDTLTPIPDAHVSRDLEPLVNTLNQLLERTSVAIRRERRFTSDAAHELRTPLTAIKTHLQVARITHGREAEEALDYADEAVARLQRTLMQLLTLSQVEGPFSWDDGHIAHADAVARLARRDAAPDAPERIALDDGGVTAELALPLGLAVTALRNLLDNALRHSPAGQRIGLTLEASPDAVRYRVCDRGPGLSAEELAVVTHRFWRRASGRGSGLGLAIVSAITARFGGSLRLEQRAEGGLEAILTLPRAK